MLFKLNKPTTTMAIEKFNKFMFIGNFVVLMLNIVIIAVAMSGLLF